MTQESILIILASLLACAAVTLLCVCAKYRRVKSQSDEAAAKLRDYLNDQNATDACYTIVKIGKGRGVFRSTAYGERIGESVIKWFDTDDESFNQREAEELCDKLNG